MPKNKLTESKKGSLKSRNYEEELLSFLNRLVIVKNDTSDEMHEYHLNVVEEAYNKALERTMKEINRIPTMNELMYFVSEFNYNILMELAAHDYHQGLGKYGYSSEVGPYHNEGEYISEIYNLWCDSLSMHLCFNTNVYLSDLLCELDLSYYDDIDMNYHMGTNFELIICVNDAQNLLFPEWHFKSIARGYMFEEESYMLRLSYLNEEIEYLEVEEDE